MSSKLNIRTGDTVMVITGDEMKDRGKTGKVLKVYPEAQRVVVQGRKMIVRHQKPVSYTHLTLPTILLV